MRHLVILMLLSCTSSYAADREKQIRQFVTDELKHYPDAMLTDLYKNYFQDAYGPGHLIQDTASAGAYLESELHQPDWTDPLPYQALGTNHDFYRINLLLVKKGIIPKDTLLIGMVKSARLARNPDIDTWKKEWAEVLEIIKKMKPDLPGLKSDEQLIDKTLAKGEVVMHHSDHYEKTYHPHYRIIHRSVFELWREKYFNSVLPD
jgi:hypothetical protein